MPRVRPESVVREKGWGILRLLRPTTRDAETDIPPLKLQPRDGAPSGVLASALATNVLRVLLDPRRVATCRDRLVARATLAVGRAHEGRVVGVTDGVLHK